MSVRVTEPSAWPDGLAAVLGDRYDIDAISVTAKPGGASADVFLVESVDGQSFWVKAWRPHPNDEVAAGAIRVANLRLLHEFHERGIDVDVPYPLLTKDGALSSTWRGEILVCFNFIVGRPFRWTAATDSALLGRAVATIHRATATLGDAVPGPARAVVADLDAVAEVLPDLAAETAAVVARCAELDPRVRQTGSDVLCHTDLTPWNLIVTPVGRLAVLDWDEAGIAPPEQDLIFTLGAGSPGTGDVAAFWSGYHAAGGNLRIDFATLEWALLNRAVDDLTYDLGLVAAPGTSDEERAQLRANAFNYGPGEWRLVDERMALARQVFTP